MTNIITIEELKNSVFNANIDEEYIQPAVTEAQSIYLREILGDNLLNSIIDRINNETLTGKYLTLVNDYIKPYLTYMVQSLIVVPINYKIRNAGVIQQYDNGFTASQMKDTQYLKDYYDNKAEFYGNRLTEWLNINASDIKEYRISASNVTNPTTSQNVTNIFLGGTKRGKCGGITSSGGGSGDTVDWSDITNKPNFATVATSGDYDDLRDKPVIFSGDYNDLNNKPDLSVYAETSDLATVATTGDYNDLNNKPTIPSLEGYATEQWVENKGYSTFSGDYNDLDNKPELFSGDYNDLDNKPTIPTVNNATLTIKQGGTTKGTFSANANENVEINLESGGGGGSTDWSDITNKPDFATVATSGNYNDLSGKPVIPTVPTNVSAFTNDAGYLTQHQSLEGYATEQWVENKGYSTFSGDYNDLDSKPDLSVYAESSDLATVATSGDYSDLTNKPTLATVATSGNYNDLTNKPTLATVATTGSYNDLSGKPTIPTVNDAVLTIKQGGVTKGTFSANASQNTEINLEAGGSGSTDWNDIANKPNFATVATSGDYGDLSNTPRLATVATSGDYDDLSSKPTLATVATSGSYNDLSDKPTIPTVNDGRLTIQKNGVDVAVFSANTSTTQTANITVPTDETDLGLTTETWTFTLQDSTTVTKTVVLK